MGTFSPAVTCCSSRAEAIRPEYDDRLRPYSKILDRLPGYPGYGIVCRHMAHRMSVATDGFWGRRVRFRQSRAVRAFRCVLRGSDPKRLADRRTFLVPEERPPQRNNKSEPLARRSHPVHLVLSTRQVLIFFLILYPFLPQALLEQVTYSPCAMVSFYFGMSLLEGKTVEDAKKEVQKKFLSTYQVYEL